MATIRDLHNPWRDALQPAHFDGNLFHVETHAIQNGRRIVLHEFPKKDLPYAEDMGRSAYQFTVRGYCIQYPIDTDVPLYMRDYRIARDLLAARLSQGGPGLLQLPTATASESMQPIYVVCQRHVVTEEKRFGGYCVFDMTFVEVGAPPFRPAPDAKQGMLDQSNALRGEVQRVMAGADARAKAVRKGTPPIVGVAPVV
jgi:hypothetical protein